MNNMTVKKLKTLVSEIPSELDNQTVWIGVNRGEGYVRLEEMFSASAVDVALDGDEIDGERDFETVRDFLKSQEYKDAIDNPDSPSSVKVYSFDGQYIPIGEVRGMKKSEEIIISHPIFILGDVCAKENHDDVLDMQKARNSPEHKKMKVQIAELEAKLKEQSEAYTKTQKQIYDIKQKFGL